MFKLFVLINDLVLQLFDCRILLFNLINHVLHFIVVLDIIKFNLKLLAVRVLLIHFELKALNDLVQLEKTSETYSFFDQFLVDLICLVYSRHFN